MKEKVSCENCRYLMRQNTKCFHRSNLKITNNYPLHNKIDYIETSEQKNKDGKCSLFEKLEMDS